MDNKEVTLIRLSTVGVVFIILKLTGVITWSWWWVLIPFWFPTVIQIIILIIGLLLIKLADYLNKN